MLPCNIVGHLKTCCILLSGWLLFDEPMNVSKFVGILLALTGVIWYDISAWPRKLVLLLFLYRYSKIKIGSKAGSQAAVVAPQSTATLVSQRGAQK